MKKSFDPSAGPEKASFGRKKNPYKVSLSSFIFGMILEPTEGLKLDQWLISKNASFSVARDQRSILVQFELDFAQNGHKLKTIYQNNIKLFIVNIEQ